MKNKIVQDSFVLKEKSNIIKENCGYKMREE